MRSCLLPRSSIVRVVQAAPASAWAGCRAVAIAAAGLALAGCAVLRPVGPDYAEPTVGLPDRWHAELVSGLEDRSAPLHGWWAAFNDPLLDELMARARGANLDLRAAAARIEEARALLGVVGSQRFPQVDGVGAAQVTRESEATVPFIPPGLDRSSEYYQLGLDATWELDFWGRVRRSVESAAANLDASVEDYRDVLVVLYAEVAATYVDVRSLQGRLAYAEANIQQQQGTLELTRGRFQAGLVPELDVRQAELNLARTSSILPLLQTALHRSIHRLGVLVGEAPAALYDVLIAPGAIPQPPAEMLAGIPADMIRQRPDVRRAERLLAAQTARIGVARADLYPQFFLPGTLSLEAPDAGDLFDSDSGAYGIGPVFRWQLFSAGRVRSNIKAEEARTEAALRAYEQTVLLALEEAENSLVGFAQSQIRLQELERTVQAAEQSVTLVSTLYRTGLTDFQNVLTMEQALTVQQDELAAAQGGLARELIGLYKALGGGWETESTVAAGGEDQPQS